MRDTYIIEGRKNRERTSGRQTIRENGGTRIKTEDAVI